MSWSLSWILISIDRARPRYGHADSVPPRPCTVSPSARFIVQLPSLAKHSVCSLVPFSCVCPSLQLLNKQPCQPCLQLSDRSSLSSIALSTRALAAGETCSFPVDYPAHARLFSFPLRFSRRFLPAASISQDRTFSHNSAVLERPYICTRLF